MYFKRLFLTNHIFRNGNKNAANIAYFEFSILLIYHRGIIHNIIVPYSRISVTRWNQRMMTADSCSKFSNYPGNIKRVIN